MGQIVTHFERLRYLNVSWNGIKMVEFFSNPHIFDILKERKGKER